MKEELTSVTIPGHKGNIPNKEYKIPPPPAKAKDLKPVGDASREDLRNRYEMAKEKVTMLKNAGKPYQAAAKKAEELLVKYQSAKAKDVAPVGDEYPNKDGSKRYPVAKAPANEWVMPKATKRAGDEVNPVGSTRHPVTKAPANVAPMAKVIPRSKREVVDVASVGTTENDAVTKISSSIKEMRAKKPSISREDLVAALVLKHGRKLVHFALSHGASAKDSENKSIAPIAKVIPRSKRPVKDAVVTTGEAGKAEEAWFAAALKERNLEEAGKARIGNAEYDAVQRAYTIAEKILKKHGFGIDSYGAYKLKGTTKDSSPFDRDTDAGAIRIIKREAAAGKTVKQIVKEYGFSQQFVAEEYPAKGKDVDSAHTKRVREVMERTFCTAVEASTTLRKSGENVKVACAKINATDPDKAKAKDETYRVTDSGATLLESEVMPVGDSVEETIASGRKTHGGSWQRVVHEVFKKHGEAAALKAAKQEGPAGAVKTVKEHIANKWRSFDVMPVGDEGAHIGMMGVNADKATSLAAGLRRKGFEYRFPVEPPKTEMVRHGFVKRDPDGGKNEWKILNERKNGYHNVTDL